MNWVTNANGNQSDLERLLTASVEMARAKTVIETQKRLIGQQTKKLALQAKDIRLLEERLAFMEVKMIRVSETGAHKTTSNCMLLKRQAE